MFGLHCPQSCSVRGFSISEDICKVCKEQTKKEMACVLIKQISSRSVMNGCMDNLMLSKCSCSISNSYT